MNRKEFIEKALQHNIIVYKVHPLQHPGNNRGVRIVYAHKFSETACSTEKTKIVWNTPEEDAFNQFLQSHPIKHTI